MARIIKVSTLLVVCLVLGAGLGSCSLSQLNTSVPPNTYDLISYSAGRASGRAGGPQIMVTLPTALRAYETDRIMVKPDRVKISYYGKSVWSDRLPSLVQERLVEALDSTGGFRTVASSREKIDPDIAMSVQIRAFHVEVDGPSAMAHIDLKVKIVDRSGRIVASDGFVARSPAAADTVEAAVDALNEANQAVLAKVASWAAQRSRRYASR